VERDDAGPLAVVWDPRFLAYDFGRGHPFDERSRGLAVRLLAASLDARDGERVTWVPEAPAASPRELERFHERAFLATVRGASAAGDRRLLDRGDTPSFPGCWEASTRLVGATLAAVRGAWQEGRSSFVPAGGLHHARPDRASGFCVLNDLAVAIADARDHGRRVAYVDLDAHHGDGVMYGFFGDGRVLDLDFHQDGRTLFPGTGTIDEVGVGDGAGLKVNVALPPGAGDEALVPLARSLVPSLLEEFRPDLLLVQHGIDGHWGDPLARLQYTPTGYSAVDALLLAVARRLALPTVVTGGGGYRPASVARALARAGRTFAGLALPDDDRPLPDGWPAEFARTLGLPAPDRWADPPRLARSPCDQAWVAHQLGDLGTVLGRRFPLPPA
jgi:acetoin utilization protein AcuC